MQETIYLKDYYLTDLFTLTKNIPDRKLQFLCSVLTYTGQLKNCISILVFFNPLSVNPQNGQLHLSNLTHLSMGLFDHFVGFALKRVSHGRLNNLILLILICFIKDLQAYNLQNEDVILF